MTWWQKLVAWLTGSTPGGRKEQVENWIAANGPKLDALRDRQTARRGAKNHYFQRLRGWGRPSDNDDDPPNDITGLPAWCSLSVDVHDGPDGKFYTLNIHVTEVDATKWTLGLHSGTGSTGWVEEKPLP